MQHDTIHQQLGETLTMLLDLQRGYPEKELHQSIANAVDRAKRSGVELSESESPDISLRLRAAAELLHALAGESWDTELPADLIHRMTALADDMQQACATSE